MRRRNRPSEATDGNRKPQQKKAHESHTRPKIARAPKAELHIHIEGSLEPELILDLAKRNGVKLAYDSIDALREAYAFSDLQSFLDIYYASASVLLHEQDFYDMTMAYVERALTDHVTHTEIFFDPQTHTARGVSVDTVVAGIERALADGEKRGLTSKLILCFLRHLSEEDALATYDAALPLFDTYAHRLIGVGLDSSERGHPPSKFERVFAKALDLLKVDRVDHGMRSIENAALVARLAYSRIALTVCPLSNIKLCVFDDMTKHALKDLLDQGVAVMINFDDPTYFGGYANANYFAIVDALKLDDREVYTLLRNSLEASFVIDAKRAAMIARLDTHWNQ
ncbi:Adenosine deaminase [Candidatus Burkholderia brachyanthoides]|nr:Adenosine deaminase [Candidatus Burkholderia brachyanthoides]